MAKTSKIDVVKIPSETGRVGNKCPPVETRIKPGVSPKQGHPKATRNPTREADLALLNADPRELFDENGRGRKLADLPKRVRDQLARVDVNSDGRIRGFEFKDKMAAIERLLEI